MAEEMKIFKPLLGCYKLKERLGRVECENEFEVGRGIVRAHENQLRRIGRGVTDTGRLWDGVFPNFLLGFERISGMSRKNITQTVMKKPHFKSLLYERRSARWIPYAALSQVVLKIFDRNVEKNKRNAGGAPKTGARLANGALPALP